MRVAGCVLGGVLVWSCAIERDLSAERFACGLGGPCDTGTETGADTEPDAPALPEIVRPEDAADAAADAPADGGGPNDDGGPDAEPDGHAPDGDLPETAEPDADAPDADAPDAMEPPDTPDGGLPDAEPSDADPSDAGDAPEPDGEADPGPETGDIPAVEVDAPDVTPPPPCTQGSLCDVPPGGVCIDGACHPLWAKAIAAGLGHGCAITAGGKVACWGSNDAAQLGLGSVGGSQVTPVLVSGLGKVTVISAGSKHTCALADTGTTLYCWGLNTSGQVGTGATGSPVKEPYKVPIAPAGGFVHVAAGAKHTCAALASGQVACWGSNGNGQLGDGPVAGPGPTVCASIEDAVAVAVGDDHSCALRSGGSAVCWGLNGGSQLGDGTTNSSAFPVAVKELTDLEALDAGVSHTVGIRAGGVLARWGWNQYGPSESQTWLPQIPTLPPVDQVSVGPVHTCVATSAETVICWGNNTSGQLGFGEIGPAVLVPNGGTVGGVSGADAVAAGKNHSCALVAGAVQCWGDNSLGQLGCPTALGGNSPVVVSPPE